MLVPKRSSFLGILDHIQYNDRLAYLTIIAITCVVFAIEFHEVFEVEIIYNGYQSFVKHTIEPNCSWNSLPYSRGGLNWYLVCVSYMVFDNSRVIPFIISLSLLPISFLFARKYTNNIIGMLTACGLALNPSFLIFDSSAAYGQTWVLFFVGGLYLIKKNTVAGVASINLSLFCKAIPIVWLPMLMGLIIKSSLKRSDKWIASIALGAPCLLVIALSVFNGGSIIYGFMRFNSFNPGEILQWTISAYRWNEEILFSTPILAILYLFLRKRYSLPIFPLQMLFISNISFFIILAFSVEGYFPYRILPNIIMFLLAASTLLYGFLATRFKAIPPIINSAKGKT